MATAKTGSFYLTETITMTAADPDGTRTQGSIDLGAYISVSQGLCIAVESVDFIWQNGNLFDGNVNGMLATPGALTAQLSDLNPGTTFVRADDQSLIASGSLNIDTVNNIASHANDLYPDNFGPGNLSEAFLVVSDSMFLVAGNDGSALTGSSVYLTARIRCKIVKLSTKDWMAIAIQSTASDN